MNFERAMLKCLLAEKVENSRLEDVVIRKIDGSVGVKLNGETFGIVAAFAAGFKALSVTSKIPVPLLIQMTELVAEDTEAEGQAKDINDGNCPELFKMFEDYIKDELEEGEE